MAYVVAGKDFVYDERVGQVKLGQVFKLGGHRNDGGLLRHRLVQAIDISEDEVAKLPRCGECGRQFREEWHRDRCGRSHEMKPTEILRERRRQAHERVFSVGA